MARNCHDMECQPPCSGKEDCELFDNGICTGVCPPDKYKHCANCGNLPKCQLVTANPRKQFAEEHDCINWEPIK